MNNNKIKSNGRSPHVNNNCPAKLRVRPLLLGVTFSLCVAYLLIMRNVFEPSSIAINLDHLKDLRYLLNSARCSLPPPAMITVTADNKAAHDSAAASGSGSPSAGPMNLVLLLVGSHPSHVAVRQVIRKAWTPALPEYHFKLVFLFGVLATQRQNDEIAEESAIYGDIVQGDFNDSYYNVTMRDLMGFQWAWHSCRQAKYVIHADDDIALDIYRLMDVLKEHFSNPAALDSSIGCYEIVQRAVPRRYGRYAVSQADFQGPYYADYCMGWLYVLTPSVGKRLFDASLSTTPIWINDVFITGTLAKALGLKLRSIGLKYSLEFKDMLEFVTNSTGHARLEMGPTRADANITEVIQEIYRRSHALDNGLLVDTS